MTALMLAAKQSSNKAVVQALIKAGANMKLKDNRGKTAFDYGTANKALMFSAELGALGLGRF
jgi:ankyrin repeat protein